jgi:dTDP-4-dehydrorhamnose 3,5-epimerase/CDP-3, 6-dideoxy-D-glycero-D-glycero-4-hexulose-5-epimerase
MNIRELEIKDCYQIELKRLTDERGSFVKTYHAEEYNKHGIDFSPREEFYSISKKNVLRGLHFQTPPYAHDKLVYCAVGVVLDFFLDIRRQSDTYGQILKIEISDKNNIALFLTKGIAHGFLSLTEKSVMVYKTNCVYAPNNDKGILWSSLDLGLDVNNPVVSQRDSALPTFSNYSSPFK